MSETPLVTYLGYDPDFPHARRYQVDAIHAIVSGNGLKYPESELYKAGRSLSFRPLSIDHNGHPDYPKTDYSRDLTPGENSTIRAEYLPEVKGVRTVFRVSDPDVIKAIETGQIKRVSIEAEGITNCNMGGVCERQNLIFTKLSLIWGLAQAGDPQAIIKNVGESVIPKENLITEMVLSDTMTDSTKDAKTPENKGESMISPPAMETPTPAVESAPTASAPATAPAIETPKTPEQPKSPSVDSLKEEIIKAKDEALATIKKESDAVRESLKNSVKDNKNMTDSAIPETMPEGKNAPAITGEALKAKRNDILASKIRSNHYIAIPDVKGEGVHGSSDASNGEPNAVGKIWTTELINLPAGLVANLRSLAETKQVPQGNDTVKFFTITTPAMVEVDSADANEEVEDSDATHTIAMIEVAVKFYSVRQTITWKAQQLITGDVISAIERGFVQSAILNEDKQILASLDAVTVTNYAGVIYGDSSQGHTAVNQIVGTETFTEDMFLEAITKIQGANFPAVGLTAILHSKQLGDLMKRNAIKDASQSGDGGLFNRDGSLTAKYAIGIRVSNQVANATDGASSARTYKAYVVTDGVTLAFATSKEMAIESFRDVKERGTVVRAWHAIGAGVKVAKTAVKVITA